MRKTLAAVSWNSSCRSLGSTWVAAGGQGGGRSPCVCRAWHHRALGSPERGRSRPSLVSPAAGQSVRDRDGAHLPRLRAEPQERKADGEAKQQAPSSRQPHCQAHTREREPRSPRNLPAHVHPSQSGNTMPLSDDEVRAVPTTKGPSDMDGNRHQRRSNTPSLGPPASEEPDTHTKHPDPQRQSQDREQIGSRGAGGGHGRDTTFWTQKTVTTTHHCEHTET